MDNSPGPVVVKTSETTVYISNMSEDVWPFISAISDRKSRSYEIAENADLGDRDLFSFAGEDNMVFILPRPVSQAFLDYHIGLFGKKNLEILVPKEHTGEICRDLLADGQLMERLVARANGAKRLVLTSYAVSPQFIELVAALRERGVFVMTPDAPEEEDAWTVNFFGSKSGIRQLAQQSRAAEPDFIMADGVICTGVVDASKIAAKKYIKERGVVIKTNKGHSGAGVLIFREGDLPAEYVACDAAILAALKEDAYWDMFPIIVESLISVNTSLGGGCPSVEFQILKNGHVEFLYYCGMRVSRKGVFLGVEINREVVSDAAAARLIDTGFFIAEQYRSAGYRGFFDVDFVAAKNGQLYVTESNVRRTGGTHVYATAERLFGKDFMYLTYILSNNLYELPEGTTYSFEELKTKLAPVLFDKVRREGVILISENLLSYNRFAYIIFGPNRKSVYEQESRMEELLRQT